MKGTVAAMANWVEEPSSLGDTIPVVAEYVATEPVPPALPQAPHVRHGLSSMLSITMAPEGGVLPPEELGGGGGGGGGVEAVRL